MIGFVAATLVCLWMSLVGMQVVVRSVVVESQCDMVRMVERLMEVSGE